MEKKGKDRFKKKSMIFGLSQEQIQRIDWEGSFSDSIYKLNELWENDNYVGMLPYLYSIADQIGYIDRILSIINEKYFERINRDLEQKNIDSEIYITKNYLKKQFDPSDGKKKDSEKIANVMFLASIINRILTHHDNKGDIESFSPGINIDGKYGIKDLLSKIQDDCLTELINRRKKMLPKGKPEFMIQYYKPDFMNGEGLFYIIFPGYFEPITILTYRREIIERFKSNDMITYINIDNDQDIANRYNFPLKIDKKKEIYIYLHTKCTEVDREKEYSRVDLCGRITEAYMDTQVLFLPSVKNYCALQYELDSTENELNRIEELLNRKTTRNDPVNGKTTIVKRPVKNRSEKAKQKKELEAKIDRIEAEMRGYDDD